MCLRMSGSFQPHPETFYCFYCFNVFIHYHWRQEKSGISPGLSLIFLFISLEKCCHCLKFRTFKHYLHWGLLLRDIFVLLLWIEARLKRGNILHGKLYEMRKQKKVLQRKNQIFILFIILDTLIHHWGKQCLSKEIWRHTLHLQCHQNSV